MAAEKKELWLNFLALADCDTALFNCSPIEEETCLGNRACKRGGGILYFVNGFMLITK